MTTHTQKLAEAQRRRLEVLEIQAAELGNAAPPHIEIEIEDLQRELAGVFAPPEPIGPQERYQATMRAVMLLSQQVAAVEVKADRLMWLLPLILFLYLIASFALEHL